MSLLPIAVALAAFSGVPSLFMAASSVRGQRIACTLMASGMAAGLAAAFPPIFGSPGQAAFLSGLSGSWLRLDALAAFFLVPVFLMGGLGSFYGLGYWSAVEQGRNARKTQLFWGLMTAGMATLVVARHALVFLVV